jgi:ABC-type polysaccharide/polyol phosphate export permease
MAIFPLRVVLGAAFHFGLAILVLLAASWYFVGALHPLALLSLVPMAALLLVFGWSLGTLAGLANVYFQDTQHLVEIGFQILFYMTPIIYDPKQLAGAGPIVQILRYNPLVLFLDMLRDPLLYGHAAPAATFGMAGVIVLGCFVAASVALARCAGRVIFLL